ncbi:probable serine/threonine-protein kinase kinX [Ylistrum balloti]|uniref:probable serine/threonine-protein kinase kinX n=1 Tax=Ylistrum balloti TaxID=509963 RepID=UPI0029059A88|nr:probable serine/threonine-protein kinase kinX [Ylistrum balloti]
MNEIRVHSLLLERYNTQFQGLLQKLIRPAAGTVCSYSNNLANRPVNNSMHRPLKLKIQNALNQVIIGDAESRGLFVGGRRRNRKKRRTRNVKEKKKARKSDGKGSPVIVRYNNNEQTVVPADERPLIESDFDSTLSLTVTDDLHYVDDLPPLIDTEDQEHLDPEEEMPFGFLKRKNKANSDKDVILEEEVKMVAGSPVTEQEVANTEQLPEVEEIDSQQIKENQDTENNKAPEDSQSYQDYEDKPEAEAKSNENSVDEPEAEDATVTMTPQEEPAVLETECKASLPESQVETTDEVVPAVVEVDPVEEVKQKEMTPQLEVDDSQDGIQSEETVIHEQIGKEVRDDQPRPVNGTSIEESSPLIKKQEPEVDMNFMCCVIL